MGLLYTAYATQEIILLEELDAYIVESSTEKIVPDMREGRQADPCEHVAHLCWTKDLDVGL